MQVQVHTDNHVNGSAGLTAHVESVVAGALERFGNRVTRVEVHIGDQNGHKGGEHDKRCAMEARLAVLQPIAVTGQGGSVETAINGAVAKLERMVDQTLEKKYRHNRHTSKADVAANGVVESDETLTTED